jgi:hypothetical protein
MDLWRADFPEQGRLIDTLHHRIEQEKYNEAMTLCRRVARERSIDKVMAEHDLDLIAFPMDSPCPRVAAAVGKQNPRRSSRDIS